MATRGTLLETVIIFTAQMEELARFYCEALDIGPFEQSPDHMGCRLGDIYFGFLVSFLPAPCLKSFSNKMFKCVIKLLAVITGTAQVCDCLLTTCIVASLNELH